MDWQASDFNNSWRVVFQALVRANPEFQDERAIERSARQLSDAIGVLNGVLARTGAYIAGEHFTVADIVIGLSVHRWRAIPYAWAGVSARRAVLRPFVGTRGISTIWSRCRAVSKAAIGCKRWRARRDSNSPTLRFEA